MLGGLRRGSSSGVVVAGLGAAGDIRLGRVSSEGHPAREGQGRISEDGRQAGRPAAARAVVEVADGGGR